MRTTTKPIETCTTFVVVPEWWSESEDVIAKADDEFCGLLDSLDGLQFDLVTFGVAESGLLRIDVAEPTKKDIDFLQAFYPYIAIQQPYLVRVSSIWYDPLSLITKNRGRSIRTTREVLRRSAANVIDNIFRSIVVVSSIFLPGALRCILSYDVADKRFPDRLGCFGNFGGATELLARADAFRSRHRDFVGMLRWSLAVPGFWTGLPTTNVGRALNLFSHAHHQTNQLNTLADMVWILSSLEALLTESSHEVRSKVIRRPELINPLISAVVTPKRLGRLYDFRSRFLHGDVSVPNHFMHDEFDSKYRDEFEEAFDVASATLILLFWSLSQVGCVDLRFTETPIYNRLS